MSAYVLEWLSLLGRWAHLVTGVAWIGASFYFVWLDNHLLPPAKPANDRVGGETWAVHGGGFYHAQKYRVAPEKIPTPLHWFRWEAYATWWTGMFLLVLIYWYGAEVYLVDPAVMALSKPVAITTGALFIAGGWVVYDLLCRSPLGANDRALGIVVGGLSGAAAFLLCQVFGGRGAFMHFGAMLGTIMVANVFFVIIPAQKKMVAAAAAGQQIDPLPGLRARQRSIHNTYFTLPVLFVMISNHYAMTYSHELNWLVLIALSLSGALVRAWFVARHKGAASALTLVVALLLLAGVFIISAPRPVEAAVTTTVNPAQLQRVILTRCTPCHADEPSHPAFAAAPAGVALQTIDQIEAEATRIHQQTVVTRVMPLGNLTGITDEERLLIDHWYRQRAAGKTND